MKIYMIDDNRIKQEWFLLILDEVNKNLKGNCDNFVIEAGFMASPEDSGKLSADPTSIYNALIDTEAIAYLVDLDLGENDTSNARDILIKLLSESSYPELANNALQEYQELFPSRKDEEEKIYTACLILVACKLLGKPTMLVSTDVESRYVAKVEEAGIAALSEHGFPTDLPEETNEKKRKEIISAWAKRLLLILNPLDILKQKTKLWFSKDPPKWRGFQYDGPPHNLDGIQIEEYRDYIVNSTFKWAPASWFSTERSYVAFHLCLKSVFGKYAQWTGEEPRYGLSLGGVYLLFLLALAQRFQGRMNEFTNTDWSVFVFHNNDNKKPISFLPAQESADAERSVQALYDFFFAILPIKNNMNILGVERIEFPQNGQAYFRLKLSWTPEQINECAFTMRSLVEDGFLHDKIKLPKAKVTGKLLRFFISSQVRRSGMGPLGTISLDEEGWLKVGR